MKIKSGILLILTLVGGLCRAEGPTADNPLVTPMPSHWTYQPEYEQTLPEDDNWWTSFHDTLLDSLICEASTANFNLLQAAHRRESARLSVKQARSAYYPTVNVAAAYGRSRTAGVDANSYSVLGQAQWEIDVFGRIRQQVKAKKAAYLGTKADYTAAMISMAADMATYYIEYRVAQTRLAIANDHLESQGRVLKIAEARHEAGLVSKLDVTQAKIVYLTTQSSIPDIKYQMRTYVTAMATLLGVYPDSIEPMLKRPRPLPAYEMLIPAGVPADLLRRRPDIISAEASLAEAAANVGLAKKEFLPTLSLEGEIGLQADRLKDLTGKQGVHWNVGPTLSWTLFDGFSRGYGVGIAREQMLTAIDNYNMVVLNAVADVDNSMAYYRSSLETLDYNTQLFEQSREALSLSLDQYKQGLSAFTNVVDAQIDLLSAAVNMASAQGCALTALIDLYKSLGGSPNP